MCALDEVLPLLEDVGLEVVDAADQVERLRRRAAVVSLPPFHLLARLPQRSGKIPDPQILVACREELSVQIDAVAEGDVDEVGLAEIVAADLVTAAAVGVGRREDDALERPPRSSSRSRLPPT